MKLQTDPITGRRVATFDNPATADYPAHTVQIVEYGEACRVGFRKGSDGWKDWGLGEGGFDATVDRFAKCPTFNPSGYREACKLGNS